jgi:hypothetical protein
MHAPSQEHDGDQQSNSEHEICTDERRLMASIINAPADSYRDFGGANWILVSRCEFFNK